MIARNIIREHTILVIIGKEHTLVDFPDAWYWWDDETYPWCLFYDAFQKGANKLGYEMEMYPKTKDLCGYSVIPIKHIEEAQALTGHKTGCLMNRLAKQIYEDAQYNKEQDASKR